MRFELKLGPPHIGVCGQAAQGEEPPFDSLSQLMIERLEGNVVGLAEAEAARGADS
jgi:hypothetical protein